jgi:hypothetical protein
VSKPPRSIRARVERLTAANPDSGFVAVNAADSPELAAALRLANMTGRPVPVTIDGIDTFVLPSEQ